MLIEPHKLGTNRGNNGVGMLYKGEPNDRVHVVHTYIDAPYMLCIPYRCTCSMSKSLIAPPHLP